MNELYNISNYLDNKKLIHRSKIELKIKLIIAHVKKTTKGKKENHKYLDVFASYSLIILE